ncbi:MAG: alpha/beta hydrolase [Oscillospiraceae bacterium]|nr:alpha/beta hydrolase [Oscillospiraceae bacterium]
MDGIVAESVYANMGTDAETMVKKLFGLGNPLLLRFLNAQIRQKLGFLPESVDLTAAAANCHIPALFVCASDDGFLDPADTERVCAAWSGGKTLASLIGGHRLLWAESGEAYREALDGLLERLG